jgi:integrase
MPGAWIERQTTAAGRVRFRVRYRLGGRETTPRYGGMFKTKREALARKAWILGELAALRVPELSIVAPASESLTFRQIAERWRESRVDVSNGTMQTYRVALGRLYEYDFGAKTIDELDAQAVAELVAELHGAGLRKQTIRKTVSVLGMVLDHAGVDPNPARDKIVKLPREEKRHLQPPEAEHVEAVIRLLPAQYRLPTLVLDGTGMRVGELEGLTWGDVDEPRGRWRVSGAVSKTGRARWVSVPAALFAAVCGLVARDDRVPERPVFQGFGADRFRTALTRACTAAGVPHFSPHDLRHRRISLLHLGGEPVAKIGELVGHDDLVTTLRTYTHVLIDEREVDYAEVLA